MLEWLLWSFLPSVHGDLHTFSSSFCFFRLPRGFVKQHHIEVMPVLKFPGQGCSGACRDQGGSCPTLKWWSWIFHFPPSLEASVARAGWEVLRGDAEVPLQTWPWHFKVILITQFIPGRHFSQARPTGIFGKSFIFAVGFSPSSVPRTWSRSSTRSCGGFLPSSSNPDLQLLVL